jgi:hypothetical protein
MSLGSAIQRGAEARKHATAYRWGNAYLCKAIPPLDGFFYRDRAGDDYALGSGRYGFKAVMRFASIASTKKYDLTFDDFEGLQLVALKARFPKAEYRKTKKIRLEPKPPVQIPVEQALGLSPIT